MDSLNRIKACPACGTDLSYSAGGGDVSCANGHRFRHYGACGGLVLIDNDFRASGPMHVPEAEMVRYLDKSAKIWNALVRYEEPVFFGRLLALAMQLRDEAKFGQPPDYRTAMDFVVERMIANGITPSYSC
jgi:hypothetical protein